jgi:hypothetical protein
VKLQQRESGACWLGYREQISMRGDQPQEQEQAVQLQGSPRFVLTSGTGHAG